MGNSNITNRVKIHDYELIIDDCIHIEIPHINFFTDLKPKGGEEGIIIFGRDLTLDREIVVKVWPPKKRNNISASIARHECRKLAKLRSANIPEIYIADEIQDCFFAVMEKIEGKTLEDWLKENHNFDEKYDIFDTVISTMRDVHQQSIYHGDLHLRNILIDPFGSIKIIDFGSSVGCVNIDQLKSKESENLLNTSESLLSPYMIDEFMSIDYHTHSPEQILEAINSWGRVLVIFKKLDYNLKIADDYGIMYTLFQLSHLMGEVPLLDFDKIWVHLKRINVSVHYLSRFLGSIKGDTQMNKNKVNIAASPYLDASNQSVINSVRELYNHWKSVYTESY